jgi:signal transduction histidine kinase
MNVYLNYELIMPLVASLIALFIIVYFLLKGRKTPLLYSYIFLQSMIFLGLISIFLLDIFYFLGIYSPVVVWLVDYVLGGLAGDYIGLGWLIFCLFYTNDRTFKYKWVILFIIMIPLLFSGLRLVDSISLIFKDRREHLFLNYFWAFHIIWIKTAISFIYKTGATILMIKYSLKQSGFARKQSLLLTVAFSFFLIISMSDIINFLNYSPLIFNMLISVGFAVTTVIFAIAIFRYRFLDVVPLALRKIVDSMGQAIIVIDNSNRIIDYNNSFTKTFHDIIPAGNQEEISPFIDQVCENIEHSESAARIIEAIINGKKVAADGELCLLHPKRTYYYVNVQPLNTGKDEQVGRIVSFHDISEYRSLVEELAATRERNRLARDVHDTLGHTMTTLITLLKVSGITCETDPVRTKEKISQAMVIAKEGLNELRRSISGLKAEKLEASDLITGLKRLISDFESSGMKIDLSIHGVDNVSEPAYSGVIYRICQEALTNSLRHGKAAHVTIVIKLVEQNLKLFIIDDGCGCKEIKKGLGLPGMEQRVKELHGTIEYGSDGEKGFNISVEIPIPKTFSDVR